MEIYALPLCLLHGAVFADKTPGNPDSRDFFFFFFFVRAASLILCQNVIFSATRFNSWPKKGVQVSLPSEKNIRICTGLSAQTVIKDAHVSSAIKTACKCQRLNTFFWSENRHIIQSPLALQPPNVVNVWLIAGARLTCANLWQRMHINHTHDPSVLLGWDVHSLPAKWINLHNPVFSCVAFSLRWFISLLALWMHGPFCFDFFPPPPVFVYFL